MGSELRGKDSIEDEYRGKGTRPSLFARGKNFFDLVRLVGQSAFSAFSLLFYKMLRQGEDGVLFIFGESTKEGEKMVFFGVVRVAFFEKIFNYDTVSEDMTLYACRENETVVSFNANGGHFSDEKK